MQKINHIIEDHLPTSEEVLKYLSKWEQLANDNNASVAQQEFALDKLFLELCPHNIEPTDILIKSTLLNQYYNTNIFNIHNVVAHYQTIDIDTRLNNNDLSLVDKMSWVKVNGKEKHFYSFASKYCSRHKPEIYPIYDSYVHKVLKYLCKRDGFSEIKDLRKYTNFCQIINEFRTFYKLEDFTIIQLDKYLWQLGIEAYK